jgi:ABC-type iron transport system FetAB permease component
MLGGPIIRKSPKLSELASSVSVLKPMFQGTNDPHLTLWNVILAFCFVIVAILFSFAFQLSLERSLVISASRCYVQLSLFGYVLHPILESNNPFLVGLLTGSSFFANRLRDETRLIHNLVVLSCLGSVDIYFAKLKRHHDGVLLILFISLLSSCAVVTVIGIPCDSMLDCILSSSSAAGVMFAMNVTPFYTARHFIPVFGMLVGNAMGSVSVAMNQCLDQIHKGKEEIEYYLACGGTRWEATRQVVKDAIKNALLPTLNSMR